MHFPEFPAPQSLTDPSAGGVDEVDVIDMLRFEASKDYVDRVAKVDIEQVQVPSEFICPITQVTATERTLVKFD